MTGLISEIKSEMEEKYFHLNKTDKSEIIKWLCGQPLETASRYWEKIKADYSDGFPNLAKIRSFLKKEFPGDESKSVSIDLSNAARKCRICGLIYANRRSRLDIIHCPRCGQDYTELIDDCRAEIEFAQDHCFMCPLYENKGHGVYGPGCVDHGLSTNAVECRSCKCKPCCDLYSRRMEEPKKTLEERQEEQKKKDWRLMKQHQIEIAKNAEEYAKRFLSGNFSKKIGDKGLI